MPPGQDWRQWLPQALGAVGSLRGGSNAFTTRWRQLEQLEQQRQQQAAQEERQKALLTIQQNQDARAGRDQTLQEQQQRLSAVNSLRTLLEDPSIEDPALFDQRMSFASALAPQLGVEAGFLNTLRPAPTVFEQREAKRTL